MGQSSSTEQGASPELREVQSLVASTGALPSLQKSFPLLSDPQTQSIPLPSLRVWLLLRRQLPLARILGAQRRIHVLRLIDETEESLFRTGKFGRFGGIFVPETLVTCLRMLLSEFNLCMHDPHFQRSSQNQQRPRSGHARQAHGLAKCGGRATGAGQHGVATAAACAKLALKCSIIMGHLDMERQSSNVLLMKHLGAEVKSVQGTLKDATSEAIRKWVGDLERKYYLAGTAVGPHPCPAMVREFQSIIGKETRRQSIQKWGGKPDVLVACVGTDSNALGMFHEFVRDEEVRLIGVEAAGTSIDGETHSATLAKGEIGVYHVAMTLLLQDHEGQIVGPHSVGVGLEYPGVSPELSFLREIGRAEFHTATDEEALDVYALLCRLEDICPALEAAHALAHLGKLCPTLPDGAKVVVNCSGHGDKDIETVFKYQQLKSGKVSDGNNHPKPLQM
ncbi:hypothetical protein SASPL_146529 [Salvia splendens]|uniref:tryptophan synthase n=1 Tax=Salvia splendens TaxID=180675 RepID=A0A8X8WDF6_SALSN|nr:hypothetical protein SASPL_146529 [Salvia splendens]